MKRRAIVRWLALSALLGCATLIVCFLGAGNFLVAPSRPPVNADLIFALGGDYGGRVNGALDLYRRGFAPRVLIGAEGVHSKTRVPYLRWQARYLVDEGVPEQALLFDRGSKSSWDEAIYALELMRSMKLDRVLVVSEPPHMRRLSWIWDKVFAGSGKEYALVAAEMDDWDPEFWWRTSSSLQFVFGEYIKLVYYFFTY
jgi:uncharacterized SAM-binding protein YcdF (DUF218 family)